MRYPWADLNADSFERLAKEYLDDHYPGEEWILLPSSGDGNRDIEAVTRTSAFGVLIDSKLWAEAKYTEEGKRSLSKGQLDPTVVSALLDNSVRALMFITNSRYPDSYILRAQRVLEGKLQGGVHFIDNEHLEAWLDGQPEIVSGYFSSAEPFHPPARGARPSLTSAQLISPSDYMEGHFERRVALYQSEELILALVVSSKAELQMKATVEGPGLTLEPTPRFPSSFSIHTGRQIVPLRVIARQRNTNGKAVVSLWDTQGDCHCTATLHYSIDAEALHLDCSGQISASQSLYEVLRTHRDAPGPGCISLVGASGSGKSFILEGIRRRSWQEALHFQVFGEPGQNARELCRSLLFMSFGRGAQLEGLAEGGRFKSPDLPSGLIRQLQDGSDGTADAQEILEALVADDELLQMFTLRSRGDAKVLVFDDVQKADDLSRRVLNKILGLLAKSANRTLVVLARHPTYTALDDAIRPLLIKDIQVGPLTLTDIEEVFGKYLQPEAVRVLLPETLKVVKTALELRYLASELRSNPDLMALSTEAAAAEVRKRMVAASIPEIATRIKVAKVEEAADLIALLDAGVPEAFLTEHFGATVVVELLASELFERRRQRSGEPLRIASSHDLLRAAYLARRKMHSDALAKRIEDLLRVEPHRRADVLGHLCLCGEDWRLRYLSEALEIRDTLLAQTRFGAARSLSHTLYTLVNSEGMSKLGLTPEEHLSIVYGYADCVNHTEGSGRALAHFGETIRIGKSYPSEPAVTPFMCQAQAEVFNMRFWQHDLAGFQAQAESFLRAYDNLPPDLESERISDAKMTTLNRLMMVGYLLDLPERGEEAFWRGWEYSERHGYAHDRANLLMDQAKSIMLANPLEALSKMEQAGTIYVKTNTQTRRLAVCKAQTAYLRSMLNGQSHLVVEGLAANLREEGFAQEYANCLLQISALHLAAGRYEDASDLLDDLSRQALEHAPRRLMLYHHLRGVATAILKGPDAARPAFERHEDLAKKLGGSYREIAHHNASLGPNIDAVTWAFSRRADAYWLEPRLW